MKAEFLLFGVICALQCANMQAMGEAGLNQPAQTNAVEAIQPGQAPAEGAGAAIDGQELYKQRAMALALVRHAHCGVRLPFFGLQPEIFQQVCTYLRQLIKHCPTCNFATFDRDKFEAHKGQCLSEFKQLLDVLNQPTEYPVSQCFGGGENLLVYPR